MLSATYMMYLGEQKYLKLIKGSIEPVSAPPVQLSTNESGAQMATISLPSHQGDIDESFKMFRLELEMATEKAPRHENSKDDYFKMYRTNFVLAWILSNVFLISIFTIPQIAAWFQIQIADPDQFSPFLTFFLWSVSIMAGIRITGSVFYRVTRTIARKYQDKNGVIAYSII
jgi:chitin synthase